MSEQFPGMTIAAHTYGGITALAGQAAGLVCGLAELVDQVVPVEPAPAPLEEPPA